MANEDDLKKIVGGFTDLIGAKVTPEKHKEIAEFVDDRGWDRSKFIRKALDDAMDKVLADEAGDQ